MIFFAQAELCLIQDKAKVLVALQERLAVLYDAIDGEISSALAIFIAIATILPDL
ncbi:hypothetical protein D3C75_1356810 [compost metagenome]